MDLRLSDEQKMLRDVLTRYLRERYDFDTRLARLRTGAAHDALLWQDLAELGVLAAALPEETGGLGGGAQAAMIVLEALGEALAVSPYLETVVQGAALLHACGGPWAGRLLPGIAEGSVRIAIAQAEPGSLEALPPRKVRAVPDGAGWMLEGEKVAAVGVPGATHWIVVAQAPQGIALFVLDASAPGVAVHPYRQIDERTAADLRFVHAPVPALALLAEGDRALAALDMAEGTAIAGLCAEAVGVLKRMLDDSVAFAKQRRQFGRPIAEFQALQHRMVDMYLMLEQARSAACIAMLAPAVGAPRTRAIAAAKATIGRAARFIGENAVQLHGAMGMTDELAVGHYFKRAAVLQHQFGAADRHVRRYAATQAPESGEAERASCACGQAREFHPVAADQA